jgi:hypothetical protein
MRVDDTTVELAPGRTHQRVIARENFVDRTTFADRDEALDR